MASNEGSVPPSSPPPIPRGLKRQASLLPAFDFDSSSPPRFSKRQAVTSPDDDNKPSASRTSKNETSRGPTGAELYPTPVPTSSLGIPPSSPPPMPSSATTARPVLRRSNSILSELRAPLTSLPSIFLPGTGEEVLFGRSSNSCDYQLSNSRLISRVHVRAAFIPGPTPSVEIECLGWNGIQVHCQGHVWSLEKGDKFESDTLGAEIMLDVQDARVILNWPGNSRRIAKKAKARQAKASIDASAKNSTSAANAAVAPIRIPADDWNNENVNPEEKSPCARFLKKKSSTDSVNSDQGLRLRDPDSPTPFRVRSSSLTIVDVSVSNNSSVDIYEDAAADILLSPAASEGSVSKKSMNDDIEDEGLRKLAADLAAEEEEAAKEAESETEDVKGYANEGDNDEDERARSQNVEPELSLRQAKPSTSTTERVQLSPKKLDSITGHLIDQLAFSRLSSTPLSALWSSLPPSLAGHVAVENVLSILRSTTCIGEVRREGKDAVGKKLEDEYYYNMDKDDNSARKQAVTETIGKTGSIRACRKVHKQYYWKKPKNLTR